MEVFRRAEEGDIIAKEEVDKFYLAILTEGYSASNLLFDPEVLIIGGGVSCKSRIVARNQSTNEENAGSTRLK